MVVVNEELMDNHQFELARALGREQHLSWTTPKDFQRDLRLFRIGSHAPLPSVRGDVFSSICREEAGLPFPKR